MRRSRLQFLQRMADWNLRSCNRMLVKSGWVVCWQTKGHNHNTSIWNIICSKHRNLFTQTVKFYWTEAFPFPNAWNISMPWPHLPHALVAGTGQSTAHSWLLWMFIFENYADPSLDRHRRLIGMRPGTRFSTYGMNGLEVLLQMPASTHGLTSLTKNYILEFGKNMWASVGSTFALLASFWHSTCGPSTKHLGFKTWCVLPICESWILERCGIGQHPMELTSWFVCRFLPHVNSSCVHIFTFCACALKRARLWRAGLTWPDLTWPEECGGNICQTVIPRC